MSFAAAPGPARAFPPTALEIRRREALEEILWEPLPKRRLRANPRVVKRKMSNFGVKRSHHKNWPQPTRPPEHAVKVVNPRQAA